MRGCGALGEQKQRRETFDAIAAQCVWRRIPDCSGCASLGVRVVGGPQDYFLGRGS